jgi:DNA-binding transcriptional ArsR family regulator
MNGGGMVRDQKQGPSQEVAKALSHPLRIRILEAANEHELSPIEFVRQFGGAGLGTTAYHFRALESVGALRIVDRIQRRGSVEHVYAAVERAMFTDAEWAKLPAGKRTDVTKTILQGFMVKASTALDAGTFDARDDSHLSWVDFVVDDEAWARLVKVAEEALMAIEEIREEAAARVVPGTGFRATFAAAAFEVPPPQRLVK